MSDREKEIFGTAITLFSYWNERPYLRLGQLLYNVAAIKCQSRDAADVGQCLFSMPDSEIYDRLIEPSLPAPPSPVKESAG